MKRINSIICRQCYLFPLDPKLLFRISFSSSIVLFLCVNKVINLYQQTTNERTHDLSFFSCRRRFFLLLLLLLSRFVRRACFHCIIIEDNGAQSHCDFLLSCLEISVPDRSPSDDDDDDVGQSGCSSSTI